MILTGDKEVSKERLVLAYSHTECSAVLLAKRMSALVLVIVLVLVIPVVITL